MLEISCGSAKRLIARASGENISFTAGSSGPAGWVMNGVRTPLGCTALTRMP